MFPLMRSSFGTCRNSPCVGIAERLVDRVKADRAARSGQAASAFRQLTLPQPWWRAEQRDGHAGEGSAAAERRQSRAFVDLRTGRFGRTPALAAWRRRSDVVADGKPAAVLRT